MLGTAPLSGFRGLKVIDVLRDELLDHHRRLAIHAARITSSLPGA
jgi:hypothetical protein